MQNSWNGVKRSLKIYKMLHRSNSHRSHQTLTRLFLQTVTQSLQKILVTHHKNTDNNTSIHLVITTIITTIISDDHWCSPPKHYFYLLVRQFQHYTVCTAQPFSFIWFNISREQNKLQQTLYDITRPKAKYAQLTQTELRYSQIGSFSSINKRLHLFSPL